MAEPLVKLTVKVNGQLRQIETRARRLEDLTVPLKLWNKYKRQDVQRRFDQGGPGWPGKADAKMGPHTAAQAETRESRIKAMADDIVRIKLRAELRRAQRRHARGKGNEAKSAATVARRYAVLKAFEAMAAGETVNLDLHDAKLVKSVKGLRERHGRAAVKAASRPLGRVAASIKSKVEKYSVEVFSTIPWAGVHNDGGVAGNNAKIPERKFLEVTEEDIAVLQTLINLYLAGGGG